VPHIRVLATTLVVVAVLALTACGGDDEPPGETASPTPTQDLAVKPEFDVPSDETPPASLQITTLAEGDGETVASGDVVAVHYVGRAWSSGEQFDASWDRGQPLVFEVGAGRVIPGWELGILGDDGEVPPMVVGERRQLVIPPDLAYGSRGAGGVIGPDETLVFVVDLLSIEPPQS
jgi:peptidylprolyl isomerase